MNQILTIAVAAIGFVAFELLAAIGVAKFLERGPSLFEAQEPDAYLRKAYQRASNRKSN